MGLKTNTAEKTRGGAGCCQPERTGAASGLQCVLAVSVVFFLQRLLVQKSKRYALHCVFAGEFLQNSLNEVDDEKQENMKL